MRFNCKELKDYVALKGKNIKLNNSLEIAKEYVLEENGAQIEKLDLKALLKVFEISGGYLTREKYFERFISASFYYLDAIIRGDYGEEEVALMIQKILLAINRRSDEIDTKGLSEEVVLLLEFLNGVKKELYLRALELTEKAEKMEDRKDKVLGVKCIIGAIHWGILSRKQIETNKDNKNLLYCIDEYTYLEKEFSQLKERLKNVDDMYSKESLESAKEVLEKRIDEDELKRISLNATKSAFIIGEYSALKTDSDISRYLSSLISVFRSAFLADVSVFRFIPNAVLNEKDRSIKENLGNDYPKYDLEKKIKYMPIKDIKAGFLTEIKPKLNYAYLKKLSKEIGLKEDYTEKIEKMFKTADKSVGKFVDDYLYSQDARGLMFAGGWNPAYKKYELGVSPDFINVYLFIKGIKASMKSLGTKNPKIFFLLSRITSLMFWYYRNNTVVTKEEMFLVFYSYKLCMKIIEIVHSSLLEDMKKETSAEEYIKKGFMLHGLKGLVVYGDDKTIKGIVDKSGIDEEGKRFYSELFCKESKIVEDVLNKSNVELTNVEFKLSSVVIGKLKEYIYNVPSYGEYFSERLGQSKAVLSKVISGKRRLPGFLYMYDMINALGFNFYEVIPEEVLNDFDKNLKKIYG